MNIWKGNWNSNQVDEKADWNVDRHFFLVKNPQKWTNEEAIEMKTLATSILIARNLFENPEKRKWIQLNGETIWKCDQTGNAGWLPNSSINTCRIFYWVLLTYLKNNNESDAVQQARHGDRKNKQKKSDETGNVRPINVCKSIRFFAIFAKRLCIKKTARVDVIATNGTVTNKDGNAATKVETQHKVNKKK